jgi:hypothetical protein
VEVTESLLGYGIHNGFKRFYSTGHNFPKNGISFSGNPVLEAVLLKGTLTRTI